VEYACKEKAPRRGGARAQYARRFDTVVRAPAVPRQIGRALGDKFAGFYAGITAHTPRQCVIDGAAAARAAEADLLVAVGGGSVIDATKVMLLCLWHDIRTTYDILKLRPVAERVTPVFAAPS
jgi:alcohol dehydrogenase class IV